MSVRFRRSMRRRPVRTLLPALLAVASLSLAACGQKHAVVTHAETEGVYVDLGQLDYQAQISRILNPAIAPDTSYVSGVPEFASELADDETWFGVFIRVQNQTDEPHEATTDIKIVDTTGEEFRPLTLDPEANAFAYRGQVVEPGAVVPSPDSAPGLSSAQGRLLLFKLTYEALGNRPVELILEGEDGSEATIVLDL